MTCTHYNFPVPEEKMVRVITDTDLCNEADDPFAVVQALLSPKFDNVGVVAAHFGTRDPNGMQKSWQGLKDLTVLMQLTVPVLHGAPHALPDAATPVPSEGAKLIIREAMKEDASSRHGSLVPPATRYSTLQDLDAGRHTEIDMFSGALMRMGQELGIPTPYNEYTYHMIKALEEKNDGLFDYAAKASDLTCAK